MGGLKRHWQETHCKTHGKFIAPVFKRPKVISFKTFVCDFCGKITKDRNNFRKHLSDYHILRDPELPCMQCDATFSIVKDFKNHRRKFHRGSRRLYSGLFLCDHCEFSTKHKQYLAKHVKTHKENLTKCPICHKFVKILDRHIHGHKMNTCQFCQKEFSVRSMPSHMEQHKKSQKCEKCDEIFLPVEMRK